MTDIGNRLEPSLKVPSSEVHWLFIADYYDGPISGLARWREQTVAFGCFAQDIPDQHIYTLHALNDTELEAELRAKAKFEAMVGTHWSFDDAGQPLPPRLHYPELRERFYIEEPHVYGMKVDPLERPVLAWFDTRDAVTQGEN
jgi:hypothetical protein